MIATGLFWIMKYVCAVKGTIISWQCRTVHCLESYLKLMLFPIVNVYNVVLHVPTHITPSESLTHFLEVSKLSVINQQNYDKLNIRTGHFTPLPNGCSPLKRELKEYIS